MINKWFVTGDTHGAFTRFKNYDTEIQNDSNTAIIILGDAGLNFTLDEHDSQMKNFLSKRYKFRIYCVRGNHEARPQDVPNMELIYDEDVCGEVYMQPKWPQIRYFKDFGIYQINNYKIAVIGGAYSVDKWYRLEHGHRWFENEELTTAEMHQCANLLEGKSFDFIFTHTCPLKWEPSDLFLGFIDQSTVSKKMENFLDFIEEQVSYGIWLFGHYHADRIERPRVEQFYVDTEDIDEIKERWDRFDETGRIDWWLSKSPMFYENYKKEENNG